MFGGITTDDEYGFIISFVFSIKFESFCILKSPFQDFL